MGSEMCIRDRPDIGLRSPEIVLSREVFPIPEGPVTANISPEPISKFSMDNRVE